MGRRPSRRRTPTASSGAAGARRREPPFWRERLAGHDLANFTEADLPSLPILTKAEMMTEFDRILTVPGLTRARVKEHSIRWTATGTSTTSTGQSSLLDMPEPRPTTSTAGTRSSPSSCRAPGGPGDAAKTRPRYWRSASVAAPDMNQGVLRLQQLRGRRSDVALLRCHTPPGRHRRPSQRHPPCGAGPPRMAEPHLGAGGRGEARTTDDQTDLGQRRGRTLHSHR